MTVLVTGSTGYIGGRLASRLVERGLRVRLLVRDPRRILGRWWADKVDVVTGDVFDAGSLARALEERNQLRAVAAGKLNGCAIARPRDHRARRSGVRVSGVASWSDGLG